VHVLRNIHRVLGSGGILIEAHPLGVGARVEAGGARLGRIDETEFGRTVKMVTGRVDEAVALGLFVLEDEVELEVVERFDDAEEAIETVNSWAGTRMPPRVAERVRMAKPPIDVRGPVVYRRFRAL
jgi:hypothetical protein